MNASLKRRALGRGLGALIPGGPEAETLPPAPAPPARRDFFLAPIEDVYPTPDQPRSHFDEARLEELAQSIRAEGILQPLVVRARPAVDGGGYWLIAGERRWRAAQRAGLHEVPVVVREAAPARAFEMALVENIQRADLDAIEEAEAYRRLVDEFGYTQDELAGRVGKDRATISNALRLLKLPGSVRELVQRGSLGMGHARALLGLEDSDAIERTARQVAQKGLSVRATEELVRRERQPASGKDPHAAAEQKSAGVRALEERLTRLLGARVKVRDRGGNRGGTVEIGYANLDDLDRILEQLHATSRG